jgi:large subunit ribosomal protein L2
LKQVRLFRHSDSQDNNHFIKTIFSFISTKGEKLFRRVGGGLPVYWHFMDFKRVGPTSGPPLVEKVIQIIRNARDRTGFIALVAHADIKRYILATENMKVGDLIRTSGEIPRLPVKANEGSN